MMVTRKQFVRYAVLPGFRPRLQELFFSGFQYIPYFIALVYSMVKLLPANHPYLDAGNIGRFGLRHVIAEAANNLQLSSKNLDQIAMFLVVIIGLVLIFVQIFLLAVSFLFTPAIAGVAMPTNFTGFFITPAPAQDLAMIMLDLVFGVPNLFNSCVNAGGVCQDHNGGDIVNTANASIFSPLGWPFPIHDALHELFRLYSTGLLVVATLITCYFIATVALETAQTGTPFGKRFNKLWAPLRIVVAFGLLIPIGYGLNSSQYIVLYAAKFGSGFATNGWNIFNAAVTETYLGQRQDLVSEPNVPEVGGILQFMYVAHTCAWLEWINHQRPITAYVVKDPLAATPNLLFASMSNPPSGGWAAAGQGTPPAPAPGLSATYDDIINFITGDANIIIRFGVVDRSKAYKGYVRPICGEITVPLSDPRPTGSAERGTEVMQRYYVFVLQELWRDVYSGNPAAGYTISTYTQSYSANTALTFVPCQRTTPPCPTPGPVPPGEYRSALQAFYKQDVESALRNPGATGLTGIVNSGTGAVNEQVNSGTWNISPTIAAKGWAGAALWYNRVAEMNGAVTESVASIPSVSRWPDIMEYVREKKRQQDQNVPVAERFNPKLANGEDVPARETYSQPFANAMWAAFSYWQEGDFATTSHTQPSGNIVFDSINAIFGTEGLYSMRKNPNVHPLAQLTGVGRSLIESAVRNLGFATAAGGAAAVFSTFDLFAGATSAAISSFLLSVCMITMSAGFVLYYIVPFLPFIYFFFAVGGWLKAIFEAMIGAPLWALAHIRIDGNGLPGAAAVNGYFLIFEIFLRPILIIFGLLASISIFSALVSVLNQVWDLVTANLSGFDVASETGKIGPSMGGFFRSALDEFFLTVIYAIVVYMMAMSSFKLIDLIPANILRWMGQSVATENDARENAAESLVSTSTVGSNQAISAIGGTLKDAVGKAGQKAPDGG
jgi:conjugal transfer/type IV secretion protein DotA/TraY